MGFNQDDLRRLQEHINHLFEQWQPRGRETGTGVSGGTWSPPVDIRETAEEILLWADLPGVGLDRIELKAHEDRLILRGERPADGHFPQVESHRAERPGGIFHREFSLPRSVDPTGIRARLKDGVLEVKLPKKRNSQSTPMKIEIG